MAYNPPLKGNRRYGIEYIDPEGVGKTCTFSVRADTVQRAMLLAIEFIDKHHIHPGDNNYCLTTKYLGAATKTTYKIN